MYIYSYSHSLQRSVTIVTELDTWQEIAAVVAEVVDHSVAHFVVRIVDRIVVLIVIMAQGWQWFPVQSHLPNKLCISRLTVEFFSSHVVVRLLSSAFSISMQINLIISV